MTDESDESRSLDILGIKPVSEAINKVTSASVDAASELFNRICLPAAEEFGLLLQDKVRNWRAVNLLAIARKTELNLVNSNPGSEPKAHPRLFSRILEQGSWTEDPIVQDLWAGLLSASCTEDGDDESNLLFVNLLADMTKLQARLLKHACESATKITGPTGLPYCETLQVTLATLVETIGENDIHRIDREVDNLRDRGLLTFEAGLSAETSSTDANLTPTSLALHMYVRCQGSRCSAVEYFAIGSDDP